MRTIASKKELKKLKDLILYIVDKCQPIDSFGSTVLNKLLLYSDFYYYAQTGKSITGERYQKGDHGIIPTRLLEARTELIGENKLRIIDVDYWGNIQKKPELCESIEIKHLSKKELKLVDEVIERFGNKNATEISQHNHKEATYQYARDGEEIPYYMAYFLGDIIIPDGIMNRAVETAKKLGYQFSN